MHNAYIIGEPRRVKLRGIAIQWLLERDAVPLAATYEAVKSNLRRSLAP